MGNPPSSQTFQQLLAATINDLERARDQGERFVPVSRETLAQLGSRPLSKSPASLSKSKATATQPTPPTSRSSAAAPLQSPPDTSNPAHASTTVSSGPIPSMARKTTNASIYSETFPHPPAQTPPRATRSDPAAHRAVYEALRSRALECTRCPNLVIARKSVVFGVGDPDAELFFVGEAPGADEDTQGEPFVGKAGQLLTKMILAMGLTREQVYIANILKCRPDTPGQVAGNRKPTPEEMATCIPYLQEQIDLIQPRVLVALGSTAIEGLLGKSAVGITRLRGNWSSYRNIPLMPTYHPAYVLRNQALTVKRQVWEDLLAVMERLEMPISTKQRQFFLNK